MKNLFVVQLGVSLWLASWGITGWFANFISPIASWFLSDIVERGILLIDLTMYSIKLGMQEEKFKELAKAAHDRATARVYTEEEKVEIRKQYLDAIRDFGRFGVRDKNP